MRWVRSTLNDARARATRRRMIGRLEWNARPPHQCTQAAQTRGISAPATGRTGVSLHRGPPEREHFRTGARGASVARSLVFGRAFRISQGATLFRIQRPSDHFLKRADPPRGPTMRQLALACTLSILIVLGLPIAGPVLGPALRDPLGMSIAMVLLVTVAFYGGVLLAFLGIQYNGSDSGKPAPGASPGSMRPRACNTATGPRTNKRRGFAQRVRCWAGLSGLQPVVAYIVTGGARWSTGILGPASSA